MVSDRSQLAWIRAQTSFSDTHSKTLLLWLLFSPHTPEASWQQKAKRRSPLLWSLLSTGLLKLCWASVYHSFTKSVLSMLQNILLPESLPICSKTSTHMRPNMTLSWAAWWLGLSWTQLKGTAIILAQPFYSYSCHLPVILFVLISEDPAPALWGDSSHWKQGFPCCSAWSFNSPHRMAPKNLTLTFRVSCTSQFSSSNWLEFPLTWGGWAYDSLPR